MSVGAEVKVAVVGGGAFGIRHIETLHRMGALAAVCEASAARRSELEARFPGIPMFDGLEGLLQGCDAPGVVVATPPFTHHALGLALLRAGRDVLIEKPMTMHSQESRELVDLAHAAGRVLMVGHLMLYHAAVVELRARLDRGELGALRYMRSQRLNLGRVRAEENVLWSFAPHDLSLMLHLLDEVPTAVSCTGGGYVQGHIEDFVSLAFRFDSGRTASIQVGWLEPQLVRRHTLVGERACAIFDEAAQPTLSIVEQEVDPQTLAHRKGAVETPAIEAQQPLQAELQELLDCIRTRREARTPGTQGLAVAHLLDKASESLQRRGEWMDIDHDLLCRPVGSAR